MGFDIFCPTKFNKSSRKASTHQANRNQSEAVHATNNNNSNSNSNNNNNNHNNNDHLNSSPKTQDATSMRYVTTEFHAVVPDELTVEADDLVLYLYSDNDTSGKKWSRVLCLKTNKEGFVPSEILIEPRRVSECKKKIPRSIADPIEHTHGHHSHKGTLRTGSSAKTCSNGDSLKIPQTHLREHQARFDMPPNSLQGSSGCQTFQKYPDFTPFSPPSYYNLCATDPQYDRFELDGIPFHREGYGLYVVMHNFVSREENDLSVRPGDYVTVLNKEDNDWYWVRREYDHAEGFVPTRFICPYEQVQSILNKGNSTVTMKSSNQNDFHTYINHRPDKESLPTDQQSSVFQHI